MNSFLETLKQLGPSRLGIMAAILLGMLMFFVFLSVRISAPQMKLLYSDLSSSDAGAIAAKLEEFEIPYEISADGSRVIAPEDAVGRARMLLAEAGLPNGGSLGYEIFDKQSGFGTTSFVQNINMVRALEGELSRTISSLDNIRSARVHLVLPQRALFSRENKPSSASVFLGIRPGASAERRQIIAIQSLVASAVPELKMANVSIIDSDGNLLAKGEGGSEGLMSLKAEELRRSYETRMTEKVEDQVSRIVGYGNVRAIVTAEMKFDRITTSEELFAPETVVRSSQVTEESSTEREPTPEDISVGNNLPGVGGDLLVDGTPSAENSRLEEITNFEISKTIRNTVREVGEIRKMSVAVVVDGRYVKDEEGNKTYQPRSESELEQISALVRSAVGLNEERGDVIEVINMQFAEIDTDEEFIDDRLLLGFEKSQLLDVAEFLIVGIMIILVALLVLQPMVNRLLESSASDTDEDFEADLLAAQPMNPALAAPEGGDVELAEEDDEDSLVNIAGIEGKVKASTVKKVEEIIENHPAETVSVIRSWMTQES